MRNLHSPIPKLKVFSKQAFVLLTLFSGVIQVGCASLSTQQSGKDVSPNGLPVAPPSSEKLVSVRKVYQVPENVHAERIKNIRGTQPTFSSSSMQGSAPVSEDKIAPQQSQLKIPEFERLVRAERWSDLLTETESDWNMCAQQKFGFTRRCRELGRARAVAFVRLGHGGSAWSVQEILAENGSDSEDALVFSGLYLDVGATSLCVQLTGSALQWEPREARRALWALRSKCLRFSDRADEARSAVRMGLTEFPQDSALLLESAFVAFGENNLTQGCEILEQLYLKKTRQVAVSYNWAQCLIRRRDAEEASKVIAAGRQDWPLERGWLILSGELALLGGRVEQARQFGFDYLSGSDARDPLRAQAERLTQEVGGEK